MWILPLCRRSSAALALTSMTLFAASARAQAPQSSPSSLESEVKEVRIEDGAIREQLRCRLPRRPTCRYSRL